MHAFLQICHYCDIWKKRLSYIPLRQAHVVPRSCSRGQEHRNPFIESFVWCPQSVKSLLAMCIYLRGICTLPASHWYMHVCLCILYIYLFVLFIYLLIYVYIYIYVCVDVCICIFVSMCVCVNVRYIHVCCSFSPTSVKSVPRE